MIEPVDEAQARIARAAYRDYALAREKGEPLLYKGTDFGHTGLPTVMAE